MIVLIDNKPIYRVLIKEIHVNDDTCLIGSSVTLASTNISQSGVNY